MQPGLGAILQSRLAFLHPAETSYNGGLVTSYTRASHPPASYLHASSIASFPLTPLCHSYKDRVCVRYIFKSHAPSCITPPRVTPLVDFSDRPTNFPRGVISFLVIMFCIPDLQQCDRLVAGEGGPLYRQKESSANARGRTAASRLRQRGHVQGQGNRGDRLISLATC